MTKLAVLLPTLIVAAAGLIALILGIDWARFRDRLLGIEILQIVPSRNGVFLIATVRFAPSLVQALLGRRAEIRVFEGSGEVWAEVVASNTSNGIVGAADSWLAKRLKAK